MVVLESESGDAQPINPDDETKQDIKIPNTLSLESILFEWIRLRYFIYVNKILKEQQT